MAKPYKTLRDYLKQAEITSEILAQELGIGVDTVSRKLCDHSPWTSDQMWQIMEILCIPDNKLHEVFPRNGQNNKEVRRKLRRQIA